MKMNKMEEKVNQLSKLEKQLSQLSSLHFWFRNKRKAGREKDDMEIRKSHDTILFVMEQCDKHLIPISVQNKVLFAAENDESFYSIQSEIKRELDVTSH